MDTDGKALETLRREDLQEKLSLEDCTDPDLGILFDLSRDKGLNFLDNARKSMIDNFKYTKWIYQELEEIKRKIGNKDSMKDVTVIGYHSDQEERAFLTK